MCKNRPKHNTTTTTAAAAATSVAAAATTTTNTIILFIILFSVYVQPFYVSGDQFSLGRVPGGSAK